MVGACRVCQGQLLCKFFIVLAIIGIEKHTIVFSLA